MSTQVLRLSKAAISLKFKSTNPKATAWARAHAAELVKDVTDNTRAALRRTITRGFEEQLTVDEMTRMIRSTIGLTEQGADSMMDLRRELENADGQTVRGIPVPEGGLSDERIGELVESYSDDLVDTRAETIARTETMRASNEGQLELWGQGVEEGFFGPDDQKLWILTDDDRLCPICEAMDGTTVPLDEEFVLEELDGETVDAPPAHPRCRCTVGLVLAPEVKAATRHAEFDEGEHPRDDKGQFTDGGGDSSAGQGDPTVSSKPPAGPTEAHTAAILEKLAPPPAATSGEKDSIVEYQDDSDLINGHLRGGGMDEMNPDDMDPYEIEQAMKLEEHVSRIEEAMSRSVLIEDVKLYRGVRGPMVDKLKPGTVFKDEAFVSTTYNPKVAKQFAGKGQGAVLHIIVPKGTPALHINGILGDRSEIKTEREILLPRGLQLKVTHVDGKTVYAQVVGHGA